MLNNRNDRTYSFRSKGQMVMEAKGIASMGD